MLTDAFYEGIIAAKGENDLNMLSNSQAADLITHYEKFLKQKYEYLEKFSYDDIISVWEKLKKYQGLF